MIQKIHDNNNLGMKEYVVVLKAASTSTPLSATGELQPATSRPYPLPVSSQQYCTTIPYCCSNKRKRYQSRPRAHHEQVPPLGPFAVHGRRLAHREEYVPFPNMSYHFYKMSLAHIDESVLFTNMPLHFYKFQVELNSLQLYGTIHYIIH
jgi:hypothetical protein